LGQMHYLVLFNAGQGCNRASASHEEIRFFVAFAVGAVRIGAQFVLIYRNANSVVL
jgi:hypothetical protein